MPLIKAYNIDSDLYGLKSHSIFKSVYTVEASWRGTFGHLIQTASAESRFSLEDLRRRSIDPTRSLGIWTLKRRLRLLVRRNRNGMHCSNWTNMLELPSDMRRYFIFLSVVTHSTKKSKFESCSCRVVLLRLTSVLIPCCQVHWIWQFIQWRWEEAI
jgi:hypothetical protein